MQKQLFDNLTKTYETMSKPLKDLMELNLNTLNAWTKSLRNLDEFTQAKKPEDILKTQIKLANLGTQETITYTHKVSDILANAMTQMNEAFVDVLNETTSKTTEMLKTTGGKKE